MSPQRGSQERPAPATEREGWDRVKAAFDVERVVLGRHWAYNIANDPKRLAFVLARYKFAAKLAPRGCRVLELGCSEGIGVPILAESAAGYLGVDLDVEAVDAARRNWAAPNIAFETADFLGRDFGSFGLVVSMDVVEHVEPERESLFWQCVHASTGEEGVAVIGTPNVAAEAHASEASRRGHVNLFDGGRLRAAMLKLFHTVFLFSMNDEVVHTGFTPMAHFLIAVGCYRRTEVLP